MRTPDALATAVLLAATVPFRERPPADLTGKQAVVADGRREPMAITEHTETLNSKLRDRGADVTVLPHDGGHTIDARELPLLARFVQEESIGRETCDGG